MIREGNVAAATGLGTIVLLTLSVPQTLFGGVPDSWHLSSLIGPLLYFVLINMILRFLLRRQDFEVGHRLVGVCIVRNGINFCPSLQVAVRSAFLAMCFTFGAFLICNGAAKVKSFGIYLALLSLFHFSEFMAIAVCNPKSLSTDSFVINHSLQYTIAAMSSWIEFFLESHFFPQLKEFKLFWIVGAMVCIAGEVLRKLAMVTASNNFTHLVQFDRSPEHKLIRHGIYSVMRHPSYVGWFWWSIGTQIVMANPVCAVLYTLASWMFFKDRIFVEEITLINFFGHEYIAYKKEVPTGLPYIDGYAMNAVQAEEEEQQENEKKDD